ncbi:MULTISPECIES: K(+)-transporting ATPase subunit C [unclassified Corynebacterium]|uniref:K(+)-transporting ATPase subunit C n=1 Tax=unclassified Corynebacterium TaxID=2624378 RepID=UPI00034E227D|nr:MULTISPECIES: K(+)-transporting ATPase subunit C [Corynebacterium]EPD48928.1 K+-transporting ATPase, C subunit [Corynebacterium sp. HFH0082]MDK8506649.1 K(+)-transporting ATPase subunit C [Corynebacterium amycolatum]OFJ57135.1 K+-transporting ATPase subunit C [Corynebacterium sp. HMSC076C10]
MNKNFRLISTTIKAYLLLTVVLGLLYPAAIWAVGRIWSDNADGSLIYNSKGEIQGSELIAQEVTKPGFFYPRPSAAGDNGYDAMSSSASNVSPCNKEFQAEIEQRRKGVAAREGVNPQQVPIEAVTASGSGLDPHISQKYAELQAPRVAKERNLPQAEVERLISENSENTMTEQGSQDGGRLVNVVKLNAALTDGQ